MEQLQFSSPPLSLQVDFQLQFNKTCTNVNVSGAVAPDPLSIELQNASSTVYVVQDVMEFAADENSRYKFTVSFCDKDTGYSIDTLSGLENADDCQWYLFYRATDREEPQYQIDAKISYFSVAPNSTVVLSYEPEPTVPPQPSPTPTPAPPDNNNKATPSFSFANCLAILLCLIVGLTVFK